MELYTTKLFSTSRYKYLEDTIMALNPKTWGDGYLLEAGEIERKTFPDGESYHRILSDVEDRGVVLIGGTIDDAETMEIFDIACSIAKSKASSLTIIIPYFGYSTMERVADSVNKAGEIVKAKTRAILLSAIPTASIRYRVVLIDVHSEGIPYYFEGGVQPFHLYAKQIIFDAFKNIQATHPSDEVVIASTDAGRAKWVESLSRDLEVECAVVIKRRKSGTETQVAGVNADVKGKVVVIYDDMIRTGGSLMEAAKVYKEAGAKLIYAISTHGVIPGSTSVKLKDSNLFEKIIITDTHPNAKINEETPSTKGFLEVKSIAPLILEYLYPAKNRPDNSKRSKFQLL